jgi:hypothetical protein
MEDELKDSEPPATSAPQATNSKPRAPLFVAAATIARAKAAGSTKPNKLAIY